MSIAGTWYNELGSTMTLSVSGSSITGTYVTPVGNASGTYTLVGSIDAAGSTTGNGQAVAWVVVWNNASGNSHSVTAWSGQYQTSGGIEEIDTLWLLTSEEPSMNEWASTQINKDIFTRSPPTALQQQSTKKKASSHPQSSA